MFGLSFLSPAFLAATLGAAVPIALHLFHRRVDPIVRFSALRLLRRAPVEQAHKRRLRELLLLALRVAACILLAVAFARPYLAGAAAAAAAPVTIVVVDTSFSLTAPGQFEKARRFARQAVQAAPATHAVGVVAFGDRADVPAPPSSNRATALAAIEQLKPGFGATRYRAALARAAELIGARDGRIVVVTDLQQSGWDARDQGGVPARLAVDAKDVGAPAGNLAVVAIRREPTGVVVVVQNFGTGTRTDTVRVTVDRRQVYAAPVTVAADASTEVRADVPLPPTGALAAAITDPTGFAADNVRYLALDQAESAPVLIVTNSGQLDPEAFYLAQALQAGDRAPFRLVPSTGDRFSGMRANEAATYPAVVVLATRGIDHRGRTLLADYVKGGGGVLIAAGQDVDADVIREALGDTVPLKVSASPRAASALAMAPADARHPVMLPFATVPDSLAGVRFDQVARIDGAGDAHVITQYANGAPALVEWRAGRGRVLLFASDLNNRGNDFPLHPAFVPFAHELLQYLAARPTRTNDVLVADVPDGVPAQPGVATLAAATGTTPGRPPRVAVNVDVRESDPARTGVDGFVGAITRLNARAAEQTRVDTRAREESQRLWQIAVALALAALVGETVLGRRLA